MWFFQNRKKAFRKWYSAAKLRSRMDDDLLDAGEREKLKALLEEAKTASPDDLPELNGRLQKILPPYRHAKIREFLDLILVVGAVAFGIRGLYFQPFRIPTSSMQPTLYGIHYLSLDGASNPLLGKLPGPLNYLMSSGRRAFAAVSEDGLINVDSLQHHNSFFSEKTSLNIGNKTYALPGDPAKVIDYAKLDPQKVYRKGEVLANGYLSLGDHLFVERFSLYLMPPRRGDVMVFCTEGLKIDERRLSDQSGYYYIKRLAALPGDAIRIRGSQLEVRPAGEKRFRRIQELAPAFGKVYSGKGGYQGHLAGMGSFPGETEFTVPENHFFMLGDNSKFSLDSRFFGPVPRRNLIGRAWLVFWPFSRRWGWVDRQGPLEVPTGESYGNTFPVMYRQ